MFGSFLCQAIQSPGRSEGSLQMKRCDSRLCNEEQLAFEWPEPMRGQHIAYDHFPGQDLERLTEAVISRIAPETRIAR